MTISIRRFDLHAVIGTVVDAALPILGDRRQRAVWTAVHLIVAHKRQLVQVNVAAALDDPFHGRIFLIDDNRRDRLCFARQTSLGHVAACHLAREIESDLGFSLGDFAVEHELELTHLAVEIERPVEDSDGKFLLRAEVLDNRSGVIMGRIDRLGNMDDFVGNLSAALFEKRAQALGH